MNDGYIDGCFDAVVPSIVMREALARYGVAVPTEIVPTGIPLPGFVGGNGACYTAIGTVGRMRLMPDTAWRHGLTAKELNQSEKNLHAGGQYFADLIARSRGDLKLVRARVNAGENAVLRHGRRIPPFAEARAHVPRRGYCDSTTRSGCPERSRRGAGGSSGERFRLPGRLSQDLTVRPPSGGLGQV